MDKKPYYISTAIAYTSAKPHIGNTYEIVLADAIARYKRMTGYDVYFQTGTDEHGQKIQEKAEAAGITPQQYVDKVAGEIKANLGPDEHHLRQVHPHHRPDAREKGAEDLQEAATTRATSTRAPTRASTARRASPSGPRASSWTAAARTAAARCMDAEEEAYFFKMSKYADRLMKHIEEHPEFIQPESRKNEMVNNFLKPGLQDLCVSRTSFSWGIPVDFDPGHVVYVWLDALTNYITFCGYDPDGNHDEHYKKFWPADVHLIGKDIIRFHTIYWPIFLMALGEPLPEAGIRPSVAARRRRQDVQVARAT